MEEFIALLATNKKKAFEWCFDKYQQKVYWHARQMLVIHEDAADISQQIWMKIWKNLDTFNQKSSLYTWIYKITTNECLTFIQKKNKQFTSVELSERLEADTYFDNDALQIKFRQAINELPEKQKQVFILKYFDEVPYKEMSEILETSIGALKASYHHASKKIQNFLTSH